MCVILLNMNNNISARAFPDRRRAQNCRPFGTYATTAGVRPHSRLPRALRSAAPHAAGTRRRHHHCKSWIVKIRVRHAICGGARLERVQPARTWLPPLGTPEWIAQRRKKNATQFSTLLMLLNYCSTERLLCYFISAPKRKFYPKLQMIILLSYKYSWLVCVVVASSWYART